MSEIRLDDKGVVVACRSCRARNRIAYEKLEEQNRCGQCKATLPAPDEPIDVRSETEFYAATRQSAFPALVDFWAPWCGPCRIVAPELARIASANAGHFLVLKVNTEEHQGLASAYRVMSIPSLALIHRGEILSRTEGARPADDIQRFLDAAVATASPRLCENS
jgi:thioredoxin 2